MEQRREWDRRCWYLMKVPSDSGVAPEMIFPSLGIQGAAEEGDVDAYDSFQQVAALMHIGT